MTKRHIESYQAKTTTPLRCKGVFLLPLNAMLVHQRSLPHNFVRFPQQFASNHLYTWAERGTVRVKCHAQENNTMPPARAQTRTVHFRVKRTNHEDTAPRTFENNQEIPFLDASIKCHDNNAFSTSIYHKKTFTGLYAKWDSLTPRKYRINFIQSLIPVYISNRHF